jgi:hypothetical protein
LIEFCCEQGLLTIERRQCVGVLGNRAAGLDFHCVGLVERVAENADFILKAAGGGVVVAELSGEAADAVVYFDDLSHDGL